MPENKSIKNKGEKNPTASSTTTAQTTQFPRVISEREMTKGLQPNVEVKNNSHFTK